MTSDSQNPLPPDSVGLDKSSAPGWVRAINIVSIAMLIPSAVSCLALMLHVIADVVARQVFNSPIKGTLDITSDWWMVALVFLALGYAQQQREHVRATVVPEILPDRWKRIIEVFATVLLMLLALAIAYYGFREALDSRAINESSEDVRSIPIWPPKFLIPLGALSLALQCVASIYEIVTGKAEVDSSDVTKGVV